MFTNDDHRYMALAIELAAKGRFTTTPNPNVGCVIVKNAQVVGQGYHQRAGEGHAEVNALKEAGQNAKGATAYVTLEPCSHYGRTPPCAEGLIKAGISRVVAAMVDPNPQVAGKGLAMLEDAGIETASGLLQEQARALNKGFLKRMEQGLPYVTCKLAASLDGKTALKNGQSKWITGPNARKDVQRFRAQSCAILSGADTVIMDDAKLNVRIKEPEIDLPKGQTLRQPLRVIIDSQNRLTPDLALFQIAAPILILRTHLDNQRQWPHFVEQIELPAQQQKISCRAALEHLAERGINHVWLESGATLAGVFARQQLIDEYVVYLAPKLIGCHGKSLVNLPEITVMDEITQLEFLDVRQIGEDIRITAITR
ncbi:bifunctional diaminohydroxyphosphoribosylaminopyrimidine deaminase/5-amino-6-(5-phosphoribosylamino)uracil reductase RibD [Pseudoalteromonas sp. JBTF-M23]|uniref:Riboflavin biosynthesis protein RibD n=1 Tax=Pseudoalteromonas caenipelagi TaxID=2726988 RepID=A0A849VLW0_9GAMM|nr:bifunctional diaminohydroxyphosphoribosylaminopyrimidine deaminase/5-amino-6-(5-phosphoribosylamino)uracil reductase RibD [Pseudoalteromonas caenipelagi]NOU52577.1 bifunctional diaminohydroxyphosphoribosylaminopyrimidine deaminase/5-amino-6-(5-phosphoribosylamino)uracil reductase RibD [Pseudoalteromonas caenipelagi]